MGGQGARAGIALDFGWLPTALHRAIVSDHMLSRRSFLGATVSTVALPLAASAQQAGRTPTVGMLLIATREQTAHFVDAFEDGMRALGYVAGRNIVYAHRFADGSPERLVDLAAEMVKSKLDVIVTGSAQQTLVVKKATSTVPIVMALTGQPVALGLIASLKRPGGNLTGLTGDVGPEIVGKRLAILKEVAPRVRHVAILRDPAFPWSDANRQAEEEAAKKLGIRIERIDVSSVEDFERAFATAEARHIDGFTITSTALFFGHRIRMTALVAKSGRPAIYSFREFPEAGGLVSYGPNSEDLCRRAATYVDRILRGAKPGDLPVEQPTKFQLVINVKAAKALGLTVPPTLLLRADHVIQ
jgi:ABC-type uncharacterized transport system substrate-binding protein